MNPTGGAGEDPRRVGWRIGGGREGGAPEWEEREKAEEGVRFYFYLFLAAVFFVVSRIYDFNFRGFGD